MRDIGALGMAPGADKPADQRAMALARSLAGQIDPQCQRLVDVARAVDPDPWRGAVRATIGKRDPATIAALRKLADDAKGLEAQPWPSLMLLGTQLFYSTHEVERAESVLRRAWRLKPDEFFVNLMLSVVVSEGTGAQQNMAAPGGGRAVLDGGRGDPAGQPDGPGQPGQRLARPGEAGEKRPTNIAWPSGSSRRSTGPTTTSPRSSAARGSWTRRSRNTARPSAPT